MNRIIGKGWIQYIITVVIVLCGTILFAAVMQKVTGLIEKKVDGMKVSKASIN